MGTQLQTMVTINKKNFLYKELKWVISARSDDDTRIVLGFASIVNGWINCADGFRIHSFNFDGMLEDGLYRIIDSKYGITLIRDNTGHKFPDINLLRPNLEMVSEETNRLIYASIGNRGTAGKLDEIDMAGIVARIVLGSKAGINNKFLKDVLNGQSLECFVNEDLKPIVFKDVNHYALLMPIKIKDGQ